MDRLAKQEENDMLIVCSFSPLFSTVSPLSSHQAKMITRPPCLRTFSTYVPLALNRPSLDGGRGDLSKKCRFLEANMGEDPFLGSSWAYGSVILIGQASNPAFSVLS
jgi:hypothetical protein